MKYKTTHKDRYGNMRSLEIDTGEKNMEVPPMTSMIPQYEAVGGLAENHPGEPKGSDTVPAWLTPGEFVVNKEATDIFGPQIKQMNDIGREIQDGNMSPSEASQIPMHAYGGQLVYAKHGTNIKDERVVKMLDAIIEAEGGAEFTDYPGDHPTKFGVTLPTYNRYIDSDGTKEDLKKLTENEAKQLFYDKYFIEPGIHKLPEEMWHNVLDQTVNSGPKGAINILQRTIGADVDGTIGPNTIARAHDFINNVHVSEGMNPKTTFDNLYSLGRDKRYKWLVAEDNKLPEPKDPKNIKKGEKRNLQQFEEGWLNRSNEFKTIVPPTPKPNLEVAAPPNIPSPLETVQDGWRTMLDIFKRNSADDSVQAVDNAANMNEAGGVPHTEMIIPELPVSKPKPHERLLDPSNEYDFKNKGGPIYASQGVGLGTYEEEMLKNLQNNYGSWLNPFDNTYSSGFDYGDATMPESYRPPAPTPMPDVYADPNKITPPLDLPVESISEAPIPDEFIMKPNELDNLSQQYDSTTITDTNVPGSLFKPPAEYSDRHVGAGPMPPDIPVSDWNADPDKLNPPPDLTTGQDDFTVNAMNEVPVSNEFAMDPNDELSNLGQKYDSTSMTSVPGDILNPFEGYAFSDTKPFDNAYDQMVKEELEGSPAYSIPFPFPDYRPDEQVGMEGIPTFTDKHEGAGPITEEDVVPIDTSMWRDETSAYNHKFKAKQYQTNITKALNQIDKLRKKNPNDPKINELRENITKWEEQRDYHKRAESSIRSSEKRKADNKELHKNAELLNKIVDLEKYINSESITQSEKERAQEQLDILNAQYKETELSQLTTDLNAGEKQLKEVVKNNHIDNKKEDEISAKLSSKTGAALMESESNDPNKWGKAEEMLKGTLGFLFGDIFDSKELGRAIAVYLGSRALGYEHGESIGYVSKQYLKRVDTKNAAYETWLLANASKYTKKSLSKFKKTRDPGDLIPVGSVPRSQGEQAKWYNKNGQARMAYKFKIKDASGDDHIYWSWDKDGKSEVEEGWHQDAASIPGTNEFKDRAKKYRDDIEEQLKVLLDKYDISQARDPDKNIYENKYHTDIMPAIDKDAVYDWAIDKGVQPEKIGSFLQQAMILATKEARESGVDKPGTILPYLDRVTIDEQTKNVPKLLKDGDYKLDTFEAAALNKKIKENYGAPTNFYNSAWEEYQKGKRESDGKPWPEVFKELAADDANEASWTPFALFVDNLLYEWMKENKSKRGSGDFTLDTYGKD